MQKQGGDERLGRRIAGLEDHQTVAPEEIVEEAGESGRTPAPGGIDVAQPSSPPRLEPRSQGRLELAQCIFNLVERERRGRPQPRRRRV